MSEILRDPSLTDQVRRMLRIRIPLIVLLLFNLLLVLAAPLATSKQNDVQQYPMASDLQAPARSEAKSDTGNVVLPSEVNTDPARSTTAATNPEEELLFDPKATLAEVLGQPADRAEQRLQPEPESGKPIEQSQQALADAMRRAIWIRAQAVRAIQSSPHQKHEDSNRSSARPLSPITATIGRLAQRHLPVADPATLNRSTGLVLKNPFWTGGKVRFVVDGQVYTLRPGESEDFPGGPTWIIQFHRGDDRENAKYVVSTGHYTFHVTEEGWDLSQTDARFGSEFAR